MVAKVCERSISMGKSVVPRTIRYCILFGYTRHLVIADTFGKVTEEVVTENAGDAPK